MTVRVGPGDEDQIVAIPVGEELLLALPEPMTGYRWAIEGIDGSATVTSEHYEDLAVAPGGATSHVFVVAAQHPGPAELRLKLWRDWEGESSVQRRLRFRLQIA